MNNAIVIQQIYPNTPGVKMLELTQAHHQAYCDKWKIDYKPVYDKVYEHDEKLGSFAKIKLIQQAIKDDYLWIIWLDADTLIRDFDADLRDAVPFDKIGACWQRIPQLHHWNVGALYIDSCRETRQFIDEWLSVYPPPQDGWNEQGVFNRLAMASKTVVTVSDRWNATFDVSMVPDAVVLGFHGQGDTETRIKLMAETFNALFPEQEAQGTAEVTNDG